MSSPPDDDVAQLTAATGPKYRDRIRSRVIVVIHIEAGRPSKAPSQLPAFRKPPALDQARGSVTWRDQPAQTATSGKQVLEGIKSICATPEIPERRNAIRFAKVLAVWRAG
jgi:hypothetical protein